MAGLPDLRAAARSAALAAAFLLAAGTAHAVNIEGVLSPGTLSQAHAKAEDTCDNCHTPFKKTGQDERCVGCHDHQDIGRDLAEKKGFHGKIKNRDACRTCHTEHKGREAKIVVLDEKKFDHEGTNYPLKDSHLKVECAKCHVAKVKFRDAKKLCYDCHKKDDDKNGHKGSLGEKCGDCHTIKKWKDTFFDHDKTRFPLKDKHADPKVKCADCHPNNHYKNTPLACVECHKKDDDKNGHKGKFGRKCESCHVEKGWKTIKFDHDRDTKYPLRWKHAETKVKCKDCHTTERVYEDKLKTACIACHKKDDKHKGSEGDKCESCHSERGWKVTHDFDHDKTKFPLRDKHADPKVKCEDCHKTKIYTDAPKDCYGCHQKDDDKNGHKGKYGRKCESCHVEKGWKTIRFDHDRDTKYPLRGKHADPKVKCKDCHTTERLYEDKLKSACIACHRKDDKHKGQEGDLCEQCHVEQNWKTTKNKFDHDLTNFPLLGKHRIDCAKCHKTAEFKDAKSACISCHEKDDQHKMRLGSVCEDCHNALSWKRWDFDHDKRTRFKLDGAHRRIDCYACHSKPVKGRALLPMACDTCHDHDDAHGGAFGKQCERCHITRDWATIKEKVGALPAPNPFARGGMMVRPVAGNGADFRWNWNDVPPTRDGTILNLSG